MEMLTDTLVSQMLNSLDSSPANPSQGEKFFAHLVCKNLTDLCETGLALLNKLQQKGASIDNLPDRSSINWCKDILKMFYSDDMFVEDEDIGFGPHWGALEDFNPKRADTAYRIYRAIKNNIVGKPESKDMQDAVLNRDKEYFIANFESIFADVPFKDALTKFRNFLATDDVDKDDQDYVWEFFEALMDIFIYEEDNLADLEKM